MNNEPVGYIPDIALPTLTKEESYCVINATKLDESDIPLYTHPVKELTDEEILREAYYILMLEQQRKAQEK